LKKPALSKKERKMPMTYDLESEARIDINSAQRYYASIDLNLAGSFLDRFEEAMENVMDFPEGFIIVDECDGCPIRRHRLKKFPYTVYYYYDKQAKSVLILKIVHSHSNLEGMFGVFAGRLKRARN
jgi:plasmid stabilization system protein ParE